MEPSPNKTQASARRLQKYREEYNKTWPFITRSSTSESHVRCDVCGVDVNIASGGKNDITKHIYTQKHRSRLPSVSSFLKPKAVDDHDEDAQVVRAEKAFAAFVVKQNIPPDAADHARILFQRMFPDSKIAEKFASAKTKD